MVSTSLIHDIYKISRCVLLNVSFNSFLLGEINLSKLYGSV